MTRILALRAFLTKSRASVKPLLDLEPTFKNLVDGIYDSDSNSHEASGSIAGTPGTPGTPADSGIHIHPDAVRIPKNLSAQGLSATFTDEERFKDYEIHKSVADKPYLGPFLPRFQEICENAKESTTIQLISVPSWILPIVG